MPEQLEGATRTSNVGSMCSVRVTRSPSQLRHADKQLGKSTFLPSGRKRALLIGICYKGQGKIELAGCVHDIQFMHYLLCTKFGFQLADFVVMTDRDESLPSFMRGAKMPTRENIIAAMKDLLADAQPGDSLFFHFCGHGSQVKDKGCDEIDGLDETILPCDFETAGEIIDDELNQILVYNMPSGVRLTALLDCCHSGTGFDLPHMYEASLVNEHGAVKTTCCCMRGLSLADNIRATVAFIRRFIVKPHAINPNAGEVFLFSGCQDHESALESDAITVSTGALTYAFIAAMEHAHHGDSRSYTYRTLLETMREKLRECGIPQTPQFSTSHLISLETQFVI
jgi:metacaspase-1